MIEIENDIDNHVDSEITSYLSVEKPKSFFLFAGAGSGKTRSLVSALTELRDRSGRYLRLHGKQVAIITYTIAACEEIQSRLQFDPIFRVSTIHSFIWDLIQGYNSDIKEWLLADLRNNVSELEEQIKKGRPGTKILVERQRSLESKQRRIEKMPSIRKFIYSPTGDNRSRDSLNHSEVIKIGADFLKNKNLLQKMLITKFPILLIDESQDTNKLLMDAFLGVQVEYKDNFGLGLFGDTMQRIYSDGKVDLGKNLAADWATPAKVMNHRCPKRVIRLINKIRSAADSQQQRPRSNADEGHARLYIAKHDSGNKFVIEQQVRQKMAEVTADPLWGQSDQVKTLILEHHMAAKRMDFAELFEPLYKVDDFKTGLRDGSLPFLRFFSELVWPLVKAKRAANDFAVATVVRKWSPLLSEKALKAAGAAQMRLASVAVGDLTSIFTETTKPSFSDVLQVVAKHNLFEIPESLHPFIESAVVGLSTAENVALVDEDADEGSEKLDGIRAFLSAPFEQIERYSEYVTGEAPFGTHQGVKGLEFPRVVVVIDDEDAGGFLFSYEKLFGVKERTDTDLKNEQAGVETGIDRTRRLFYVTCSRSKKSLSVVAYSSNPEKIQKYAVEQGWFDESEIELL